MNICADSSIVSIISLGKYVLDIIGIFLPILLILLITYDLSNMIIKADEKPDFKKLGNRFIMAISFFFVPVLVSLVFNFIGINYKNNYCFKTFNKVGLSRQSEVYTTKKEADKEIEDAKKERSKELKKEKDKLDSDIEKEKDINKSFSSGKKKEKEEQEIADRKKRNEYYYGLSFGKDVNTDSPSSVDRTGSIDCTKEDCYSDGFYARTSAPTKGTKYFPELDGVLLGQCVWYAKGRSREIVDTSTLPSNVKTTRINAISNTSGNGKDWNSNNPGLKIFKHGYNARTASILSYNSSVYGHVAIAEVADSSGVVISDGWRQSYGGTFNWISGPRWQDVRFRRQKYGSPGELQNGYQGAVYLLD